MNIVGRNKPKWRIATTVFLILGLLALIPLAFDFQANWLRWLIVCGALWLVALVLYLVGRWVTGRPLGRPSIRR